MTPSRNLASFVDSWLMFPLTATEPTDIPTGVMAA